MQDTTSLNVYKSLIINQTQPDDSLSETLRLARQFLANTPAPKTRETYARELCFFVSWYGRDSSIASIGLEDLLRYKVMLEEQFAPATVAKKIAALKSLFRFAKRTGVIISNPAEELRVAGSTKDRESHGPMGRSMYPGY